MKTNTIIVGVIAVLIVIGGLAYVWNKPVSMPVAVETASSTVSSNTTSNPSDSDTDTGASMSSYTDPSRVFTFNYPSAFSLLVGDSNTQSWRNNSTSTGRLFATVSIPKSYMPGTNFGDAKFTVGASNVPGAIASCLSATNGEIVAGPATINGTVFSKFTGSDAGAGNFYDTTSYRTVRDGECYAVEYTIHSSNIMNYDPSQGVKAFDQNKVQGILEGMAGSFTFL